MQPLLYESHMHTPLCRHARGEPEEYAAQAQKRGLKGIIVTCHNPLPDGIAQSSRMYPEDWPEYLAIIQRAKETWAGRVDVRLGLEADYLPGLESFIEKQLASESFHHVLGSVHPQLKIYQERYFNGDDVAFCRYITENAGVTAIPVSAFYDEGDAPKHYARFAFCKREEVLAEAIDRLKRHFDT